MLEPCIDLKHDLNSEIETLTLGSVFKTVHQGGNKCLSNAAVIENYQVGHGMARDYYNILKPARSNIPPPPRVRVHDHNINDVHKVLFEVHIISDLRHKITRL